MKNLVDGLIDLFFKGVFGIYALVFLIFAFIGVVAFVTIQVDKPRYSATQDGFEVHYSKLRHSGYVSSYTFDSYTKDMEITIPDSYDGAIINEMGGDIIGNVVHPEYLLKFNMSKLISKNIIENSVGSKYDDKAENVVYDINYYDLKLCIGKNIEDIYFVSSDDEYKEYDEKTSTLTVHVYQARFYCYVSADNKTYYSKDGKVYRKNDDSLVTRLSYYDGIYKKEKIGGSHRLASYFLLFICRSSQTNSMMFNIFKYFLHRDWFSTNKFFKVICKSSHLVLSNSTSKSYHTI